MKNIIAILILTVLSLGAIAQNKMNVSVDETNGKIHLKLEKVVNGEKTVIDKTYDSIEEMKNDPELEGMDLHIFDGDKHKFVFKEDDVEGEMDINVVVEIDEDDDVDHHKEMKHAIFLKSEGEGEKVEEIKIKIDEDGKKHIYRNGKEVDPEEWEDIEGDNFEFKTDDGKRVIVTKEGKKKVIVEGDEDEDVKIYKMKVQGDVKEVKEMKKIRVKVSDKDKIHLEEIHESPFKKVPMYDAEKIDLSEIMYYPDSQSGKLKLQFKADANPTEIKLTGINGKVAYAETLDNFKGKYKNEIDISDKKKGIYLLQVIQGDKAFNKKIVIE